MTRWGSVQSDEEVEAVMLRMVPIPATAMRPDAAVFIVLGRFVALRMALLTNGARFMVPLPADYQGGDVTLVLTWALNTNESDQDTLDADVSYIAVVPGSTGEGMQKTETTLAGQVTCATASGLSAGDVYEMTLTLASDDEDNPLASARLIVFEVAMANFTGVSTADLLAARIEYA